HINRRTAGRTTAAQELPFVQQAAAAPPQLEAQTSAHRQCR
uniref:Transposase n=1 Tax=Globodera pallida TaxID=36090 RepID=A0A183CRV1_GLOPA